MSSTFATLVEVVVTAKNMLKPSGEAGETRIIRDLMAWTDFIQGQPYISEERMGVTGGSYGGYMSVWIIGHTDRFKAAVPQRCVSNLVSMWGSSDLNWIFQEVLDDKPPF